MPSKITVTFDGDDYKLPSPDGREGPTYFTIDKTDALDTARSMWGAAVVVRFKTVEEHPLYRQGRS